VSRESMSRAQEITIALSKNSAQSDNMSAAPRDRMTIDVFTISSGAELDGAA